MVLADSSRRSPWLTILIVLLLALAGLWTAAWFYGSGVMQTVIDGWKEREAGAGRIYACTNQSIGGFPFAVELHCADASAEFRSIHSPLALKTKDIRVSGHLWQPTVLITDFTGPLTVAELGQPARVSANWQQARSTVHGLPTSPVSASIEVIQPVVDGATGMTLFKAGQLELNGRLVSGTVRDKPVIELVLKLAAVSVPSWHPAAAIPIDADITTVLLGLKDFAPKPWPDRLRELQADGGRIEITNARLQQRDTIAIANGTLSLSPAGRLNGELRLTVANLEQFLPALGLDQMLSQQQASPQVNKAFGALDRILPGLGNVARQNAAPMIATSINLMGEPAQLEGMRAVALPLRFDDGLVSLGPLKIGMTPAIF